MGTFTRSKIKTDIGYVDETVQQIGFQKSCPGKQSYLKVVPQLVTNTKSEAEVGVVSAHGVNSVKSVGSS